MPFFDTLEKRAREIDSLLCVSLNPQPDQLPEWTAEAALSFCQQIVSETADVALAFKPNIAVFEELSDGFEALQELIQSIPEEIPVILDARTGYSAAAEETYHKLYFNILGADAVTLNPYLGYDSLQPFFESSERGVFLVCKTANPGSAEIQDSLLFSGIPVYEHIAGLARSWNKANNVGLHVGSAPPFNPLRRARKAAPTTWIMAHGVGPDQIEAALSAGLRPDGLGVIIPISSQISRADDPGTAAREIVEAINMFRQSWISAPVVVDHYMLSALAADLYASGCIQFGEFTIDDGVQSPMFIDLRILPSLPELLFKVASAYYPILQSLTFDRIAAIPYTGLPIAIAVGIQGNWPLIYPRKESDDPETPPRIEGIYQPDERVAVLDDLTTTGISKFKTIEALTKVQLYVEDIVVLIDRESGANKKLVDAGFRLHAVFTITKLAQLLLEQNLITTEQVKAMTAFVQDSA